MRLVDVPHLRLLLPDWPRRASASFLLGGQHVAESPEASLSKKTYALDPQALTALEFFQFAIDHFSPRAFHLTRVRRAPLIAYSDAEWEVQLEACDSTRMLGISKGLGGILFDGDTILAAAAQCPDEILVGLHTRKTQIIPLELLAAAGLTHTFAEAFADRDVIFFIGNQAVCAALCKSLAQRRHPGVHYRLPHDGGQVERPDLVRVGAQQGEPGGRAELTGEFSLCRQLGSAPPSPAALG